MSMCNSLKLLTFTGVRKSPFANLAGRGLFFQGVINVSWEVSQRMLDFSLIDDICLIFRFCVYLHSYRLILDVFEER